MKDFVARAYQGAGIEHLVDHDRCALHAGCGMGKTVQALMAMEILRPAGEVSTPLAIGPLRVARSTWGEEAAKWTDLAHLKVVPIIGTPDERKAALRQKADLFTVNYENLPWLVDRLKADWPFDMVIADEAVKLKGFRLNQGGQRTRALAKVAHRKVRRFVELTGMAAPNGLKDLWGQLWYLDGGKRLGRTYTAFTERWFQTGRDGYSLQPLPFAFEEISELISDLCLSMEAKDYFDLPGTVVNNIYVDLPTKAMSQYREMEKAMFLEIAGKGIEAFNAASKTIKCLQLANGAIYLDDKQNWAEVHKSKLDALESVIEEAGGKPVIVAYQFQSDLERLRKHFPQGRLLDTKRDEDDFKAGKIPVLFTHPDSAGHGIDGFQNVTNEIAFFGLNWNLDTRHQVIERIGETRQAQAGHHRPVVVHNIIARGTLDEMVLERVDTKREVADLLADRLKRKRP